MLLCKKCSEKEHKDLKLEPEILNQKAILKSEFIIKLHFGCKLLTLREKNKNKIVEFHFPIANTF
jgi:hypothetical protein